MLKKANRGVLSDESKQGNTKPLTTRLYAAIIAALWLIGLGALIIYIIICLV